MFFFISAFPLGVVLVHALGGVAPDLCIPVFM